jgi:hypothetical protein
MEYEFEKNKIKDYLGDTLYRTLKKYNCIIAGGFIGSIFTNRSINDVDIYFRTKEDLTNLLLDEMAGKFVLSATQKAILIKYNNIEIQFIHFKYYKDAEEIFKTFDFTVCMGAYDFKTEEFILHKDFLKHNSQRILMYNARTAFPIISALRIDKYKNKGYSISKMEFMKVMMTINNLKINSYEELKEQIGGMYGENYARLFENKEEKFDMINAINDIEKYDYKKALEKIEKEDNDYLPFDNWKLFVALQLEKEIKYFEYKDDVYTIIGNEIIKLDEIKESYIKVDMQEVLKLPIIKYKYVKKENSRYYSFYDENFEYKLGEKAEALGCRGLFVLDKNNLVNSCYADRENKTIIKCLIENIEDLGDLDSLNEVQRLRVLEEVPEESLNEVQI